VIARAGRRMNDCEFKFDLGFGFVITTEPEFREEG
jgi:hypothetical protein